MPQTGRTVLRGPPGDPALNPGRWSAEPWPSLSRAAYVYPGPSPASVRDTWERAGRVATAGSLPPHPRTTRSFLCTVSPAKSHDLGVWGPREKDACVHGPSIGRIN